MFRKWVINLYLPFLCVLLQTRVCLAGSPGQNALDDGTLHYQNGKFEHAAMFFKQATEKDPGLAKAWENLGWAQYKLGRFDKAIRIWNMVLKVEPRHIELLNAVGNIHMEQEQWPEAMAAFEESLTIQNEQRSILLRLARGYEALNQWQNAIGLYRNMLLKHPTDVDVIQRLALVYQIANKESEAVTLLEAHVMQMPELRERLATLYAQRGDRHYQAEQFHKAEKLYQKANQLSPDNPRYVINLGWVYRNQQALKLAMRHWKRALTMGAANANLPRHIGDLAFEMNNFDEAAHWYEKARQQGSITRANYKHLGWAYWQRQNWDLCEKTWKQYMKVFPNDEEPPALLARFYMKTEDYNQAIQAAERSLSIQSEQPDIALLRAKALFHNKQYKAARSTATMLVQHYPEHLGVNIFMGEVLMQYHDFNKGVEQWRRVLDLSSTINPKAQFYWVKSLYETGNHEQALAEAKRFLSQTDGDIRLVRLLKVDALSRADQETAILWLERELEIDPNSFTTWMELAELYQHTQQYIEARETYYRAESFHADNPLLQLAMADLDRVEKNYHDAFMRFSTVASQSPYNRRAYLGRLDALVGMGKYQSAFDLLEKNNPILINDYEWQFTRGEILIASQRPNEAISAYRQISESKTDIRYVPVLLYHGLNTQERGVNLSRKRFSDQMGALKRAGYTAITLKQLENMTAGNTPFPTKPIIISFDDARIDSFELGTPELAHYDLEAVMFVPTGRIHDGHPFFADWKMIRKYANTGRWEMQNHGHKAHDLIEINVNGKQGAFLSNYRWLPHEQRVENEMEFQQRLEEDYRASVQVLEKELPGSRILGYAFPYSEAGQELVGTAQEAAAINQQLLKNHMPWGFIQDHRGYNRVQIGHTDPRILRRFVVPSHWAGQELTQHLISQHPTHVAQKNIAKIHYTQGRYGRAKDMFTQLASAEQWTNSDSIYYLAATDYQRENYHSAEQYLASLNETTTQNEHRMTRQVELLTESLTWRMRPSARISFRYFDDANGRTNDWISAPLTYTLKQPVHLRLEPARVKFFETDLESLRANELTLGAEWRTTDDLSLDMKLRFRDFNNGEDSLNSWLALEYWYGDQRLSFSMANYDVDTVSALREDIDVVASCFQYTQILNKNWTVDAKLALQGYNDGNKRYDALTGADYLLTTHRDWKIGAELRFSDTDQQSDFYYTPQRLIVGQANLSYIHKFNRHLSVNSQLSVGMAHDALNGDRLTGNLKLGLKKTWGKRFRGEVGFKHSRVPDYHSTVLQASLTYLL